MAFYDTFVGSVLTPKNYWIGQMQESIDESFENASTIQDDVEREVTIGAMDFEPISCRITTLVDAKTGQRVNDDYKKIIFKNDMYNTELGSRFRFSNNIWIVFSTNNLKTVTSSAYLRRCNNTINFQDKYGNIYREPCYIDYRITETQIFKEYTMDVSSGRIWVTCQLNEHTENIQINDRYIFNGNVYRVRERSKFDRQYTMDKSSSTVISFYADVDEVDKADDFVLDIADKKQILFKVDTQETLDVSIGDTGTIDYNVTYNGSPVSEDVYFESTDDSILSITTDGTYVAISEGICNVRCMLRNNPSISTTISVNVLSVPHSEKQIEITPNIKSITLNKTIKWSVYEKLNNQTTGTMFSFEAFDVPVNCFDFTSDTNSFTVKYKRLYDGILRVRCTNLDDGTKFDYLIELGGAW